MTGDRPPAGPLESSVLVHHPSQAVLNEARALDRELKRPQPAWDTLLPGIRAFATHYASVLLHEPRAIAALGQGCLSAVRSAPATAQRALGAALLLHLLAAVSAEVEREGIDRVRPQVPESLVGLVRGLAAEQALPFDRGLLVPPMLEFGQQLVMMADEGDPPQLWFAVLAELNGLLLAITRRRVAGEPVYDGRWDQSPSAAQLAVDGLGAVRRERIQADLTWLDGLAASSRAGRQTPAEVFLELSTYEHRDEREQAWRDWFARVAGQAAAGALEPGVLRALCDGLAEWIATVEDREFLAALALVLYQHLPGVLDRLGSGALDVALKSFGLAIVERLEQEAGRGESDQALEGLWRLGALLVERALQAFRPGPPDPLSLGTRLKTGPLVGQPVSVEDVIWRLGLAERLAPAGARRMLLGLVVGFRLEQVRLGTWHPDGLAHGSPSGAEQSRRLVAAAARLLERAWPAELVPVVRALLRVTPISPLDLAGPTCRALLVALAPDGEQASYLRDLQQRLIERPGPENLEDLARVLRFLRDGQAEHLDGLAGPDSLAALAASERRDAQIAKLLERLAAHAPVADKQGVDWLAQLPDPFYEPDNLAKVAGFEGLAPDALVTLTNLLLVFRALTERGRPAGQERLVDLDSAGLLAHIDQRLAARRQVLAGLFGAGDAAEASDFEKLERFERDLRLVGELDGLLEELASRCLAPAAKDLAPGPDLVLARLLSNAKLSGFEPADTTARLRDWLDTWRARLAEELRPAVLDSLERLRENPLARPSAAYQRWLQAQREQALDPTATALSELLIEDLLASDGGLLVLARFLDRL